MKLTRKELLGGAAAGALGAAGIYKLVDELVESPPRAEAGKLREEQYLLSGMKAITHEGVEVVAGLDAGESIIVSPLTRLADGVRVTVGNVPTRTGGAS